MRRAFILLGLLGILPGCASRKPGILLAGRALDDAVIKGIVQQALLADIAHQQSDSLYAAGATVIANGRVRVRPPRFAALATGGNIGVVGFKLEIIDALAWAEVAYRWISTDAKSEEFGRASFLLEHRDGRWLIKHVHSSQVLPWERPR